MLFATGGRSGEPKSCLECRQGVPLTRLIYLQTVRTYMVFLVPYDGSSVSEAALDRAIEHGKALGEEVVAVTFVATGSEYAERRKWIEPDEDFAVESARAELERKIEEMTDTAERNYLDSGATSLENGVTDHVTRVAGEVGAETLYVGTSDDTDDSQVRTPFGRIAQQADYDVHLVRTY